MKSLRKVSSMTVESYKLNFDVDFDGLRYSCKEILTGQFGRGAELDCEGLKIKDITSGGVKVPFLLKDKKLVIEPARGKDLTIDFSGEISEQSLMGIHQSKYEGGHIITTQMEPTGARSVFPCVDNPASKAIFKIEVFVNKEVEVVSNSPVKMREVGGGKSHFVFEDTPKMSTYLLYLGIGSFEELKGKYSSTEISVVTTRGKSSQGEFALTTLAELLSEYESYYGIRYPLGKLDLIAVPQFGAGAMENWGAITFRESAILVNRSVSFRFRKQIGYVISHELAHQWFGDLVTMKWWDDLWLNESFATFIGNKMLSKVHGDWRVMEDFLREETLSSMWKDGLLTTHPIRVAVTAPEEIAEIFDAISYGKGASILRMIEQFLGEESFRGGVSEYLKEHSYGSASGEDLWTALSHHSKRDVSGIMKSWLEKGGFPLITMKKNGNKVKISQARFSYLENTDDYLWQVPILVSAGDRERRILLKDKEVEVETDNSSAFLINKNGEGYYRTMYDGELLRTTLGYDLSPEFRMKLIDDYENFLLAGKVDKSEFMNVMNYIRKYDEYSVVLKAIEALIDFHMILDNDDLLNFTIGYLREKYEKFKGKEDENSKVVLESLLNAMALTDREFRGKQKLKLGNYVSLSAEERQSVLTSSSIEGYGKETIWEMVKRPENDMESLRVMTAISHLNDGKDLIEFLDYSLSHSELRGNIIYSLYGCTSNKGFRDYIWKWVESNIQKIREIYQGSSSVSTFIENMISFSGIGHRSEVDHFINSFDIPEASRAIKNGLERLEVAENLIKRIGNA
jgi:tricorn protease interacting factor F2/3